MAEVTEHLRGREQLAEGFAGELVGPDDARYDEARRVYNGMIDRRPSLVARPRGAADVMAAIRFAAEAGLSVAVRGGGHSVAGNGVCDGGVVLDLSLMKGVRVDPERKRARAAGGALAGELDRETQAFGLATPGGRVTTTGVGGFTTGGGYGWLSPKYGLACDNLVSADVVTANGQLLVASESENDDLFWGLRGGSSNFGVVTSFELKLHDVGPIIYGGLLVHELPNAGDVLRFWRDFADAAPDELGSAAVFLTAPPEPFIPAELQGQLVLGIAVCWCGDLGEGEQLLRPLKEYGSPPVDIVGPMPYVALQAMLDPTAPTGWQNYWKGLHLRELSDEAIDAYVSNKPEELSPMTFSIVFRHGGAVSRVDRSATAFGHREAAYMYHPIGCWPDPAVADQHLDWVFRVAEAMEPYATGGIYLNFTVDEGEEGVHAGHETETFSRLVEVKDKYDPTNMFCFNPNIRPSGAAGSGR